MCTARKTAGIIMSIIAAISSSSASAASDKLRDFLQLCNPHRTAPLSTVVPCLKALLAASQDRIYNMADPATELFILDISKLLRDTEQKRVPESASTEKFLRLVVALQDRHRSDVQAAQSREDSEAHGLEAADRAKTEALLADQREDARERRNAELEQQRLDDLRAEQVRQQQLAVVNLMTQQAVADQQSRNAAVQFCIDQANQRSPYAFNAPDACATNPNYYQTVLRLPATTVTNCQGSASQLTCTSH